MANSLNIRKDGALDFLSLGRSDPSSGPGNHPVSQGDRSATSTLAVANLTARRTSPTAFGLNTGVATAIVDYPIGDLIAERVKSDGCEAFLQALQTQRRKRPEYGDGL